MVRTVRIIGSGLIGTSIALGLRPHSITSQMIDLDPARERLAQDLVGQAHKGPSELVILALPTHAIASVIEAEFALNPHSIFMDVGSVKYEPLQHIRESSLPLERFVATHPMAGREIGGAQAARADLFATRTWVIAPGAQTSQEAITVVTDVIELLSAHCVVMEAGEHDRAVAAISHLPQILSSLLAGSLHDLPSQWLELAGAGLRDTTRIAASDPGLWSQIIYSNRENLKGILDSMQSSLHDLTESLDDPAQIAEFIEAGQKGGARIPGKHGGKAREYSYLPIVIDDRPGQLAAIFNECATIGVNIEDLSIEHSPGQLSALITLSLSSSDAQLISDHLLSIGWNVHPVLK